MEEMNNNIIKEILEEIIIDFFDSESMFDLFHETPDSLFNNFGIKTIYGLKDNAKTEDEKTNFELLKIIYQEIDWELYKTNVNENFQKIWKKIRFNLNENEEIGLIKLIQETLYKKNIDRRIYKYIFIEVIKLIATSIYIENKAMKNEEKIRIIKEFVGTFNSKSNILIERFSSEFEAQIDLLRTILGNKDFLFTQFKEKYLKENSSKSKPYDEKYLNGYIEVVKLIEKNKLEKKKKSVRSICFYVARHTLEIYDKKKQQSFYSSFIESKFYKKKNHNKKNIK